MKKTKQKATQSFLDSLLIGGEKLVPAPVSLQPTVQRVHCPTCGSAAERYHIHKTNTVRTQCSRCDYLMVSCAKTGRVIEAYAPSFSPSMLATS